MILNPSENLTAPHDTPSPQYPLCLPTNPLAFDVGIPDTAQAAYRVAVVLFLFLSAGRILPTSGEYFAMWYLLLLRAQLLA